MSKHTLVQYIKTLRKEVKPDSAWVAKNREFLVSQIKGQTYGASGHTSFRMRHLISVRTFITVARPLAAFVLVIGLVMGASIASVGATKNSLPGDLLYPVKLTAERIQVNLVSDKKEKTNLELSFADRRMKELQEIKRGDKQINKDARDLPVKKFNENMQQVKVNLEQVKMEDPNKAVELAGIVDEKTSGYIDTLEAEKKTEETQESKQIIKEAISTSKEAEGTAVTIIIEKHESGDVDGISTEELANKIGSKIEKTKEKVTETKEKAEIVKEQEKAAIIIDLTGTIPPVTTTSVPESVTSPESVTPPVESEESAPAEILDPEQVDVLLKEAETLLEEGNAGEAYKKIKEADTLLTEIDDAADEAELVKAEAASEAASVETVPAPEAEEDIQANSESTESVIEEVK